KNTNSGLNRLLDTRSQHLGIVNFFVQDFLTPGYTLMFNLHVLNDSGDKHFDTNGFLIRPAPVGTLARTVVDSVWLGWNGGGFSYWVRQGLPLTGTGLELVGRNSLVPSLRSSKIEGQPNFVNPGLFLFNVGADVELTPKLKAILNVNYLRFHHTAVLERLL